MLNLTNAELCQVWCVQKADESRGVAIDNHRILILVVFGLLIKGPILAAFYHYIEVCIGFRVLL